MGEGSPIGNSPTDTPGNLSRPTRKTHTNNPARRTLWHRLANTVGVIRRSSFPCRIFHHGPRWRDSHLFFGWRKFSLFSPSFEVSEGTTSPFLDIPQGPDSLSLMGPNVLCPPGHVFVNDTIGPYTEEIDPWGFVNDSTRLARIRQRSLPTNTGPSSQAGRWRCRALHPYNARTRPHCP